MYQISGRGYPDEDFTDCTMKQLLGKEGRRVSRRYRELADKYNMTWNGRRYSPEDFDSNMPLQNALSCANACLYGVCYAAIYALGLSPGLGIIHTGMAKSFVLDVADLYKEKISIPIAFQTISQGDGNFEHRIRCSMRDEFRKRKFLDAVVQDINSVLDEAPEIETEGNNLWAGRNNIVSGGRLYGTDGDKPE